MGWFDEIVADLRTALAVLLAAVSPANKLSAGTNAAGYRLQPCPRPSQGLAFVPAIVPLRIRRKRQRLPPNPPIASARGVKQSDHPRPLGAGALVDRILRFFNG